MSKFLDARQGEELEIKNRKVEFSFWPIGKGRRRGKLNSTLFVSDPWQIIEQRIARSDNRKSEECRKYATHCLQQSRDFYRAAETSRTEAAKPLLLYYCFLNLIKCFAAYKRGCNPVAKITHGLEEHFNENGGKIVVPGTPKPDAKNKRESAYRLFADALDYPIPNGQHCISDSDFFSQILIGHRVYCQAQGANFKEKFINLKEIHLRQDKPNKQVWLLARIARPDFSRIDHKLKDFAKSLSHSGLKWKDVNEINTGFDGKYAFAETVFSTSYKRLPSSELNTLCQKASRRLWRAVTSHPPYRKYYIYIKDEDEKLLHQLLSIYLATFYFGSITRYKPIEFADLLKGDMGPFIHEFFANQPEQFLYLMASEFLKQEVTRAAIV